MLNSKKRSHDITSQMCSCPKNVITPPHPPPTNTTPKKTTKKDKKRGFAEAKHNKKGKNALSLWRQCSEHAKTLFRDAAFCARPANYKKAIRIQNVVNPMPQGLPLRDGLLTRKNGNSADGLCFWVCRITSHLT